MADEYVDPSGTTDQFRAFVQSEPETAPAPARTRTPLIIGGVVAVVVVLAVVVMLLVS